MTPDQHAALEHAAKEFVETLLAKEVCLSDAECTIVRDAALSLLAAQRAAVLEDAAKYVCRYNCDHNHGKKATVACDEIEEWLIQRSQERRP